MASLVERFAANMRRARLRQHLRQEDLAEGTGLSVSYISFLERGTRSPPLDTLERVARGLGVDPLKLLK